MSDFEPLTTLMASGPMPLEEVLRIGREAAAALTNVHGELWPSAVLVSSDGVSRHSTGGRPARLYRFVGPREVTFWKNAAL